MSRTSRLGLATLVLATMAIPCRSPAQSLRLGVEFQVNQYTTNNQYMPKVASDADGDVVVVWGSSGQDGNATGIFARRFASSGAASSEFQVNVVTAGPQRYPSIAASSAGGYVVVWEGLDGNSLGVFARRLSNAGTPIGDEFQVNTATLMAQRLPAVAAAADGDFVIVWQHEDSDGGDDDVFARIFSNNGVAQTVEFVVNTYIPGIQTLPSVASEPDGDFFVVWQRLAPAYHDLFGRRFTSSGVELGGEFAINLLTNFHQRYPSIGVDPAGGFVVTWQSNFDSDGSSEGVMARRFSSAGVGLGGEFVVNAHSPDEQTRPVIAVEPDGEFVILWTSNTQDDQTTGGVFGRLFTRDAVPLNREFQVNAHTIGSQNTPAVAVGGGRFVATWQGNDGMDNGGVFAHRFVSPIPLDVDGNFLVDPLTDTILTLRYAFGFRGETLIDGAVGDGCTRCDAPSIEAYLLDLAN